MSSIRRWSPLVVTVLAACGGGDAGPTTPASSGGDLMVSVSGLPTGTAASVTVTGPGSYAHDVSASEVLSDLAPGSYTITAQVVSGGGHSYQPSVSSQTVTVSQVALASATVAYSEVGSGGGFNLRIDGMYLTQSVQTYAGAVPLVKDRDGFLRVFVTATQSNLAAPPVRVRLFSGGTQVSETTISAPGVGVPVSAGEGTLGSTWNLPVPKSLIQPNLSILAEVDPSNTVAESNESDNLFPASGTPLAMDVRTAAPFSVRLVPIRQTVNNRVGNVSGANQNSFFPAAMRMHPLSSYDVDVRGELLTSAPALEQGDSNGAWSTVLAELDAVRLSEGTSRYYFGVVNPNYSSGVAGVGYVGRPTALGWDKNGADGVAAHEWGHNWGRSHAPCGGAGNPDLHYPYTGGKIGVYGFDVAAGTLKPPTSADVMGYCNNTWISDYTYTGVLNYRAAETDVVTGFGQAMQPCLLVWGRIVNGRPVLEPSFQIVTRPSLPRSAGQYRVEGTAADGTRLFGLSFTPTAVADDPRAGAHFAFAIPLQPDRAARLDRVRLSAPGRVETTLRRRTGESAAVRSTRVRPGVVALQWDASTQPVAMVRDPSTGQVLGFARGGRAEIATARSDIEVQLSGGVGGLPIRVGVQAR
jgi:hypothetical protein